MSPSNPVGVSENVTVVAGADVVNSTSAETEHHGCKRQIEELPLNGRNPLALIGLQAGTAPTVPPTPPLTASSRPSPTLLRMASIFRTTHSLECD